jgi:ATP-dependent helicase/nuclease subunit A
VSPETGPSVLSDDGARQRIVEDLDAELAVDAGAGSGKTTVLVQRVVSLVRSGRAPMRSIAAITFTEAAAAELRTRLRTELATASVDHPELAVAVHEVDEAAVSTIHAFARRILTEHWLAAGLPPRVEVLDAPAEQIDQEARWKEFTNDLLDDPNAGPVLIRAFAAALKLSHLRAIARSLAAQHHRLDERALAELAAQRDELSDPSVDIGPLVLAMDRALAQARNCTDDRDPLLRHLRDVVQPARRRLGRIEGGDEVTVLSTLDTTPPLSSARGRSANWDVPVADVRGDCQAAEALRSAILQTVRQSVTADLLYRIAQWAVSGAARRRSEGRLTFQDLLVETCRLLRADPAVRRAVRDRYRFLLIDEFQDTDPLQVELAQLLGARSELDVDTPARLFVVGDPEQSIYRFRGADVALFTRTVNGLSARLELASNFRSVPGVLAWVDEVFSREGWDNTSGPISAHRRLFAVRRAPEERGHPPVVLYGDAHAELAQEVRRLGAEETALLICQIVGDRWRVHDGAAGSRPLRFGDVAILIPTRTSLAALERALDDADVPYRLEGVSLVWAAQEVRDLLAILRAADDPADAVAVVAALRTSALACGDDDLVRFHTEGLSWDPRGLVAQPNADGPVVRAMRLLAELHARRMWREPSEVVALVLERLHLYDLALVHDRPRDHWQRLRWVLDQARAFDETIGGTLGDFLAWIDLRQDEGWSSSLGPPEPDDDAVRILTIHGAKGLEFPVVFLTGLEGFDHPRPTDGLLFGDDGVPCVRFYADFKSAAYDDAMTLDKRLESEERRRLLYVAATRARDHLFVDLNRKDTASSLLAKLAEACTEFPDVWCRPDQLPEPPPRPAAPDPVTEPLTAAEAVHSEWVARRRAAVAIGSRQPAWSATKLSQLQGTRRARSFPAVVESTRRGGDAETRSLEPPTGEEQRLIGRAVHDTLAKLDLRPWANATQAEGSMVSLIETAAIATRAQGLVDGRALEVTRLVQHALGSPSVRLVAGHRHFKELLLAAPLDLGPDSAGPGVLDGFADLVGETEKGLVVIDFKTFVPRATTAHETNPEHLSQVAAYAYALREATGLTVSRAVVCYLFFDGTEEAIIEGASLEAAITELLETARRATSRAS